MTKTEQINAINANYEKVCKAVQERRDYRWKNYYDCIDDYSVCGICEKADCAEEDAAKLYRDLRIEEVENDGTHREVTNRYVLLNENGEVVANELHTGKFGPYWITENGFVGVPRKVKTLNKKGYTLAQLTNTYECTVNEVKINRTIRNSSMKLVESKITVLTEVPDYMGTGTPYADWQYETFFNNVA